MIKEDVFVVGVATLFTVWGVLVNCVNCAVLGSKGKYSTLGHIQHTWLESSL